jgi:tRNA-specific 2-thiouridylase
MQTMKKRVLVAMSGGVDSSVTAALLVQQGMVVEGVTMKLTGGLCCDIGAAQAVCSHLGIPHRMIDAQGPFEQNVIRDFIAEYRIGRTPNPCIRCNDVIKFQMLLSYAREQGFDALATGHYARIEQDASSSLRYLKKGRDAGKDQSYFLYRLTQDQMKGMLFPLGDMHKADVRDLARKLDLPAAERPESQDICFVPNDDYRAYLKEHAPELLHPGEMVMTDGRAVGKHGGIAFYTVGQRRKLGIAAAERLYVVRIEPGTNRVVLGTQAELQVSTMTVGNLNWTFLNGLDAPLDATVKIRYRSPFIQAVLKPMGDQRTLVSFGKSVSGVCPGQAAVFYDGDVVIGGGVIATAS